MMQHQNLLHARQKLRKKYAPHNRLRTSASTADNTSLNAPGADLKTKHLLDVDAGVHAGYDEAFAEDRLGDDVMAGGTGGDVVRVVGEEDGTVAHFLEETKSRGIEFEVGSGGGDDWCGVVRAFC